jgi:drug/metabolite transporter (DMT)-like permease
MEFLNTWQVNLLLYLFFNVIFFQFYKLSLKSVEKDGAATILLQAIAGLSQLVLIPLFAWQFPSKWPVLLLLGFACIFYAINDRLQTTVRKNLEVSVFSIMSQLGTVFLIIYGFTIFKEPIVLNKILGAGLIIAANVWLFYKPRTGKFTVNRYYVIGIIALLALATAISIDIGINTQFNLPFYIFLTLLIPAGLVMLNERIRPHEIAAEWKRGKPLYFMITGIAWGLLILFGLRAFQFGEVSVIVPLQAMATILNVLVAYIFLRERADTIKKILAALLVIMGVYLTVL